MNKFCDDHEWVGEQGQFCPECEAMFPPIQHNTLVAPKNPVVKEKSMSEQKQWEPLWRVPQDGDVYIHRNGKAYEVIALARDQDAEDILVIHKGTDGVVWSRPIGNFMGLNAQGSARFRLLKKD